MMKLLFLLGLFAAKVQAELCPRKDSPPGVLALTQGSEVILDCSGDITVNGKLILTRQNERLGGQGVATTLQTSQRKGDNTGTTGTYHSITRNVAITGTFHNKTSTGMNTEDQSAATVKTPMITTEEKMRTSSDVTVRQVTQPKRVDGVAEEGGAFSVTIEMGISSERGVSMDNKDYEDREEGLRVIRAIKRQTRWTQNGKSVRGMKNGGALRLHGLQLSHSGNYSCYREDRLVSSVIIHVGVPPERPKVSCRKKSHTSKVRCEWISRQPIKPRPQCYLLLRKGFDVFSNVSCSYSVERSRCWCAFPSIESDKSVYTARLCVANTVGSGISAPFTYSAQDILKPDPPDRVEVKAVDGHSDTLDINWSNPATWRHPDKYYQLFFHLRYRPLQTEEISYQEVKIEAKLSWRIYDALPHTQYEVQLRAKDDFDGEWSEWTSPVYAHTWTAPKPTAASDIYTSQEPFWTFPEGSGFDVAPNVEEVTGHSADDGGVIWIHVLWVFGLCLLIILLTALSIYTFRNRRWFMSKLELHSCSPPYSSSPPPPPLLQQPLMAPCQQSQHHFLSVAEEKGDGINLHNFDYFLCPPGD